MILSIDIGIKNLSLCCINYETKTDMESYTIQLWNVYDTLDTEDYFCNGIKKNSLRACLCCNKLTSIRFGRFCNRPQHIHKNGG